MTQQEFDDLDATIVHLLLNDREPPRAYCSGEVVDPSRWRQGKVKFCQACYWASMRAMRELPATTKAVKP